MTVYTGGLRARLVKQSLVEMIRTSLTSLGWFGTGRDHEPITIRTEVIVQEEIVPLNTLAISDEGMTTNEWELGSNYGEHRWSMYIDFYAENGALGLHLIHDIKDILQGRLPSIGRSAPILQVKDWTTSGNPNAFIVQIERVEVDRAHGFPKEWQQNWYACSFQLADYYGSETDS